MRKLMLEQEMQPGRLVSLIMGAPISLEKKYEYLKQIPSAGETTREYADAISALKLNPGELLYMEMHCYEGSSDGVAPFLSLSAALQSLRQIMQEEEWGADSCCWTTLEKWVPGTDGTMENPYTYYLIRDEIVYFSRNQYDPKICFAQTAFEGFVSSLRLDLPIPFAPGDLVTLNCLPFAPVRHALLLEVDNNDCCGVQMLFRDVDGLWKTGALKHGHGWGSYFPLLSPLYRLCACEEEVPESEQLLSVTQTVLRKKPERGKALWDLFFRFEEDGMGFLKTFAVFAEENPTRQSCGALEQSASGLSKEDYFRTMHVQYLPMEDAFGDQEHGDIAFNIPYEDAAYLADKFGQNSFFFGKVFSGRNAEVSYFERGSAQEQFRLIETSDKATDNADLEHIFSKHGSIPWFSCLRCLIEKYNPRTITNRAAFEKSFDVKGHTFRDRVMQRRLAHRQ